MLGMRTLKHVSLSTSWCSPLPQQAFLFGQIPPWRLGERHFMQHLLDGDPAANNGGWQRVAGTGTDAAPYLRVFNPMLQGVLFDPQGAYVRRWAPELTAVPNDFTHAPWKMPADVQDRAGCVVGKDYPAPLVDHALARERALNVYKVKG